MPGDTLTIVIVTWNTRELTLGCLASIEKADPSHAWRVIVVDNASSDQTPESIREKFPWVELIANRENLGFGRANNLALRQVTSKYVFCLNSDTRLPEKTVPVFLDFLDANPEAGLAGGQLIYPDGRPQNSIASFPTLLTELTNKSLLQVLFPRKFPGKRHRPTRPTDVDSVIGAAMMIRMEALRSVGYFDEGYFFFLEETDLCFRLKKAGWRIVFLPAARIIHFQGSSVRQVKPRARVEYQRSLIRYFEKNHGPFTAGVIKWHGYLSAWIGLLGALPGKFLRTPPSLSWEKYRHLLAWYHKGCPDTMGLQPPEKA